MIKINFDGQPFLVVRPLCCICNGNIYCNFRRKAPGMISGATGAIAVVIVGLAKTYGIEYVFATAILAGIIQIVVGVLKLGKLIRLVPHPVMFGFVNGLAIIIFMSQLDQLVADLQ